MKTSYYTEKIKIYASEEIKTYRKIMKGDILIFDTLESRDYDGCRYYVWKFTNLTADCENLLTIRSSAKLAKDNGFEGKSVRELYEFLSEEKELIVK